MSHLPSMLLASVAFNIPIRKEFTYIVPEDWPDSAHVGDRVIAALAGRESTGIVVKTTRASDPLTGLKPLLRPAAGFRLPANLLELTRWTADYYLCSWGEALAAAAGPSPGTAKIAYRLKRLDWNTGKGKIERLAGVDQELLNSLSARQFVTLETILKHTERKRSAILGTLRHLIEKGWIESEWRMTMPVEPETVAADALFTGPANPEPALAQFDDEQKLVWQELSSLLSLVGPEPALAFRAPDLRTRGEGREKETPAHTALLWGPTGSGKTAIYCEAIRHVWSQGRTAIFLVPEIGLAAQMIRRLEASLGEKVAVWHSGMSNNERFWMAQHIAAGKFRIVVGARSAIFAAIPNLGLIIVDEEHADSYKQGDPSPRYHARDLAVVRAKFENALCLLGSATPSCETIHNAQTGKYRLLRLHKRVLGRPLPVVRVVDLRHQAGRSDATWITNDLRAALVRTIESGRKAIVFLNRRGHSTLVSCQHCGYTEVCPDCGLALTYHASDRSYRCHICARSKNAVDECPSCHGTDFLLRGVGTQKIEEVLATITPQVRLARLDADIAAKVGAAAATLDGFAGEKHNLLVGTQMVTKGLDVAAVSTVGVIWADQQMAIPDFRAEERTFQLLTQVAGRAGRGSDGQTGEVIVQTFHPDHELIALAASQDAESFYERELPRRKQLGYPPFTRLVLLAFSSETPSAPLESALAFAAYWKTSLVESRTLGKLLGPSPALIPRRAKRYYVNALIKTTNIRAATRAIESYRSQNESLLRLRRVTLTIDIDPVDFM